jgi:tRNA(Arg) A34 adenosine deaminase TadA
MTAAPDEMLMHRVADYVARKGETVTPFSIEEYFTVILDRAAKANAVGDYGIGSAVVVRSAGVEVVCLGWSTMVTQQDPLGHAETNAIIQLNKFLSASPNDQVRQAVHWTNLSSVLESRHRIFLRSAAAEQAIEIFTSLEPCPMCTVAIMNAGIRRVIIALPDEAAGALGPGRLDKLPPLWPSLAKAQRLQVKFVKSDVGVNDADYVPLELRSLLRDAFWTTKETVDRRLVNGVLFDPNSLAILPKLLEQFG